MHGCESCSSLDELDSVLFFGGLGVWAVVLLGALTPASLVPLPGLKVEGVGLGECGPGPPEGPGRGVLLFPEICTMELQLLAAGSPELGVMKHVFHSLLGAVTANPLKAALPYDHVRLNSRLLIGSPISGSCLVFLPL